MPQKTETHFCVTASGSCTDFLIPIFGGDDFVERAKIDFLSYTLDDHSALAGNAEFKQVTEYVTLTTTP